MNSTAPIGQKQTGKLVQGRLNNTMPADMNKKRSLTATTKTIGKYHLLTQMSFCNKYIDKYHLGLNDEMIT